MQSASLRSSRRRQTSEEAVVILAAFHEAAHVVVAVYNGIELYDQITIEPSGDMVGAVRAVPLLPLGVDRDEGFIRFATMYLAGGAAERKLIPESIFEVRGDVVDRAHVAEMLIDAYAPDAAKIDAALSRAQGRARRQVQRLWKSIEIVAEALLEHETLDAKSIRDHLFSRWTEVELARHARRTGAPLSWLLVCHANPEPLTRYVP